MSCPVLGGRCAANSVVPAADPMTVSYLTRPSMALFHRNQVPITRLGRSRCRGGRYVCGKGLFVVKSQSELGFGSSRWRRSMTPNAIWFESAARKEIIIGLYGYGSQTIFRVTM